MPTYTQPQLQDRLKKLPQVLQEAMFSPDIAAKMFALGKKHGLTIDKIGFMAEETGYVILGFTKPQEFAEVLQKRLETDAEKSRAMASEINREIFFPLRESLKQTHQIEIESPSPPAAAPPPAPKPPLPPLPPRPAPIDLRTPQTPRPQPEKPPLSELLPKVPPPAPPPESKPPATPPPSPPKPSAPKPPAPQPSPKPPPPKPEVMPGGGVFAPPSSFGGGAPHPEPKPQTAPMPPTPTQTQQPRIINTQQEKRYDPYRETVE